MPGLNHSFERPVLSPSGLIGHEWLCLGAFPGDTSQMTEYRADCAMYDCISAGPAEAQEGCKVGRHTFAASTVHLTA